MSAEEPKIENVEEEEVPTLEDVPVEQLKGESAAAAAARHRQSKAEKKNKKAILKAGLKEYPGVKQVSIRSAQRLNLTIDDPEVFISDNGNGTAVFVVFGKFNMEDATQQRGQQAVADLLKPKDEVPVEATESDETPEELPENIAEKDVQMVIEQTGLSRNAAIKKIKEHGGDIIEAITSAQK
ncbi:nascent polypeptide-associated complex alpha subunit [Naegleria gruberi]|uniref:Nascent polypeptide-associated complex alpha subunit n=1 Tax=Naegleria gruberi TaxID=5762 RepID=D2V4E2_NAEGR|nr:nascent polypeptide-associated complex alpha subunit [Naegleria gruberi]EFC48372.1 nascent polypeptide-associated complex alpha subunit [Naegleria gruberi]|eukprot:XP_002681116.1 nascent polypeptide-associated complex alpha subunit [Naegleria gruberi strain NEG-M]